LRSRLKMAIGELSMIALIVVFASRSASSA
jgi:hypothetical protein